MNHTVSEVAPCRKKIECAYDAAEVDHAFDESYAELKSEAAIKGFRRGRAPRRLLERKFGKDVAKDVAGKLVSQGLENAMKEEKISPMADPALTPQNPAATPGQSFEFAAEVDVRPEFELADYAGLVLEEPVSEPTEAEIDERLEVFRENFADREDITEPAAKDDYLQVDANVTVGEDNEEVLKLEDQWIKNAGERLFDIACPELVDKLTGAIAGDSIVFVQAIPEDYANEKMRGKEAKVVLKVKAVQRLNLPALDDELAKKMGFDTLDELRTRLADHLRREKAEERHGKFEEQIVDQLVSRNSFDLPEQFLERQAQGQMLDHYMRLARMGASADYLRENADDLKTRARERTERSLRWSIIADAIAEKEEVEITPEEVQAHIDTLARQNNTTPAQIAKVIREQSGMYAVAAQLRDVKIVNLIVAKAELKPAAMSDEAKRREEKQTK